MTCENCVALSELERQRVEAIQLIGLHSTFPLVGEQTWEGRIKGIRSIINSLSASVAARKEK